MPNQINMPVDIQEKFQEALAKLYRNDYSLIERNCSERSIVFRLGLYLANSLTDYRLDVDCEYNRNIEECKALPGRNYNYPDLIVHKREENTSNLLIVEVKTPNDRQPEHFQNDREKIMGFVCHDDYLYKSEVHVYIEENTCSLVWYAKGQIPRHQHYKVEGNTHTLSPIIQNDLREEDKNIFDRWFIGNFDNIVCELH